MHLLDELSRALPPVVNLTSLTQGKGDLINIEGMAFNNNDIVRYVDNLKASPRCMDVTLQESVLAALEGTPVYKYKLQFAFKGE